MVLKISIALFAFNAYLVQGGVGERYSETVPPGNPMLWPSYFRPKHIFIFCTYFCPGSFPKNPFMLKPIYIFFFFFNLRAHGEMPNWKQVLLLKVDFSFALSIGRVIKSFVLW